MNKAIQLNHCARHANAEKNRQRIEYTKEWLETILFPALNHSAEIGHYNFYLHKIHNCGTETWYFEGLARSKEGLDIDLVFKTLKENGFHVNEYAKSSFEISWEDEYVY